LAARFDDGARARGEMVLLIDRQVLDAHEDAEAAASESVAELVAALERDEGLDHRAALKRAARRLGLTRDEAYRRLVAERAAERE
jgi:hypothetical protein